MVFTTKETKRPIRLRVSATSAAVNRKGLHSKLFEKQRNEGGEIHEEHVDKIAAKQGIYLDDNMINLPCGQRNEPDETGDSA